MISVVIPTLNAERTLQRALAPLVPAAVEGLVREVVVADGGSTDRTLELADDAGANIVRTELVSVSSSRPAARRRRVTGCSCSTPTPNWPTAGRRQSPSM